ncbi:hypothetical protein [Achromobacter sp.]|uniref:hypothetical protein n=1 Tax=Achromobacter sp. TaxID=134375 RepID=UPI00289FFD7C|nr:hypothetical protein [Achromobacter sp.]
MKEAARQARNAERLTSLYATFADRLKRVISRLETAGLRPRIQDAWRSKKDQEIAYRTGKAKVLYGFHNVTGTDGKQEALAVDLLDDDAPLNPSTSYILRLAAAAQAEGLVTGIRWDMPKNLIKGIDVAIAAEDWDAKVKVGWDPLHVQTTGVTIREARAGKRPD